MMDVVDPTASPEVSPLEQCRRKKRSLSPGPSPQIPSTSFPFGTAYAAGPPAAPPLSPGRSKMTRIGGLAKVMSPWASNRQVSSVAKAATATPPPPPPPPNGGAGGSGVQIESTSASFSSAVAANKANGNTSAGGGFTFSPSSMAGKTPAPSSAVAAAAPARLASSRATPFATFDGTFRANDPPANSNIVGAQGRDGTAAAVGMGTRMNFTFSAAAEGSSLCPGLPGAETGDNNNVSGDGVRNNGAAGVHVAVGGKMDVDGGGAPASSSSHRSSGAVAGVVVGDKDTREAVLAAATLAAEGAPRARAAGRALAAGGNCDKNGMEDVDMDSGSREGWREHR